MTDILFDEQYTDDLHKRLLRTVNVLFPYHITLDLQTYDEIDCIRQWLEQNTVHSWVYPLTLVTNYVIMLPTHIWFADRTDAIKFKLTYNYTK